MLKKLKNLFLNSDFKELSAKSGIFIFFKIAGALIGYVFIFFVTQNFGAQTYGLVSLGLAIFMILSIIGKFGWDFNLTKYVARKLENQDDLNAFCVKLIARSFSITSIIAIVLILFKSFISSEIFGKPQFENYLFWIAISFPFWSSVLIFAGFFRGHKKNTLFSIFNTFGRFFLTVLFLILSASLIGFDRLSNPLLFHFLAVATLFLGCVIISKTTFNFKYQLNSSINFKRYVTESNPIFIASLISILLTWVDRIIIGLFNPESQIAVYDVASQLSIQITFSLDAINSILAPKIAEFYAKNQNKRLKEIVGFSTTINSIVAILIFIPLFFYGDVILGLFGEGFSNGKIVLQILAVGRLISCLAGSVGTILQMTNHQKDYQKIKLQALVLNLVLNIVLINTMGIIGVAIATSITIAYINISGAYKVFNKLKVKSFFNLKLLRLK